jgi:hypothetical protein
MKKILSVILLLSSTICFCQSNLVKDKIRTLNDFFNRNKLYKVENLSKELLNSQYGNLTNEDKCNTLALYTTILINDNFENKNYQLGYDYLEELLELWKNGMNGFHQKDTNIIQLKKVIDDLLSKHPNIKIIENKNIDKFNTETVNKTLQIKTTQTNTTQKSTSDDKTVTLTVSGTGKTIEEARLNAIRSAIEQSFGAFISSKTEILNDNLVRDEIVSISSGNIQKYDIISQVEVPSIGYAMTLSATVSISNLTSFAESKGVAVEFKGGMFGLKIKLQKLNEQAEIIAISNLLRGCYEILSNSIDFEMQVSEPKLAKNSENRYDVDFTIKTKANSNFSKFTDFFEKTIKSIALSSLEADEYKEIGKPLFYISISNSSPLMLRTKKSSELISSFFKCSQIFANTFSLYSNLGRIKYSYKEIYPNQGRDNNGGLSLYFAQQGYPFLLYAFHQRINRWEDMYSYLFLNKWDSEIIKENFWSLPIAEAKENLKFITACNEPSFKLTRTFSLNEIESITEFKIEKISINDFLSKRFNYMNPEPVYDYGSCFLLNTKITTPQGKKNIQDIKVGDEVICFDDKGELHTSIVESINRHDNQDVYKYYVWNGEALNGTTNHWVLTSENSFSEIGKLNEMLTLVDINGGLKPITKVEYIGKETVYNFIVKDYHTYIANDIRVHNGGKGKYHMNISKK